MFRIISARKLEEMLRAIGHLAWENKLCEARLDSLNEQVGEMRAKIAADSEAYLDLASQIANECHSGQRLMGEILKLTFQPSQGYEKPASVYIQYRPELKVDGKPVSDLIFTKLAGEFNLHFPNEAKTWHLDDQTSAIHMRCCHCPTWTELEADLRQAQEFLQDKLDKAIVAGKLAKVFSDDKPAKDSKEK